MHPCPRCLIDTKCLHGVGTITDIRTRNRQTRDDNQRRRTDVDRARKKIYEGGRKIDSSAVQDILKDRSLVPTRVRIWNEYRVMPL